MRALLSAAHHELTRPECVYNGLPTIFAGDLNVTLAKLPVWEELSEVHGWMDCGNPHTLFSNSISQKKDARMGIKYIPGNSKT